MFSKRTTCWFSFALFALVSLFTYFAPFLLFEDFPKPKQPNDYFRTFEDLPPSFKTIPPFSGYNETVPRTWYDEDGIPLFYRAWQVKPGAQSSEPTKRSSLLTYGSRIACWPSTGGVWIKFGLGPDLDFLGLPRNEDVNRPLPYDPKAEDAFCKKMRLVGSRFYELPPVLTTFDCATLEECVQPSSGKVDLGFAWRPDGALAIMHLPTVEDKHGVGMAGWGNARNMEDRCQIANLKSNRYKPWCHDDPERCEFLWCLMYPDYCHEIKCYTTGDDCRKNVF